MPLRQRVLSVLIVSAAGKFADAVRGMLPEGDYAPVVLAGSVNEAQKAFQRRGDDIVIINSPLPDDYGHKFAIDVCANPGCVCMLIVSGEVYGETYSRAVGCGVFLLRKPTSAAIMSQALDWLRAAREKLRGLEKQTVSLEDKMAEIRIVNRAKWALIESLSMTEADAHRYIEKQAMDRCVTRREIAEGVINTYGVERNHSRERE